MNDWLQPLRRALEGAPRPVSFFFRDDDAGWEDGRLYALLGVFERARVPLDLAVIPTALGDALARGLEARVRAAPDLLAFHQHGYAHCSHEKVRRKCEFGDARNAAEQRRDIETGAALLAARLHGPIEPFFTPPWNRCNAATSACLAELGFSVLSRDRGAAPLPPTGLRELPVDVDWCKRVEGHSEAPAELARKTARAAAAHDTVGIMLHHAVMDEDDLAAVGDLIVLLSRHPASRCALMRQVARWDAC